LIGLCRCSSIFLYMFKIQNPSLNAAGGQLYFRPMLTEIGDVLKQEPFWEDGLCGLGGPIRTQRRARARNLGKMMSIVP